AQQGRLDRPLIPCNTGHGSVLPAGRSKRGGRGESWKSHDPHLLSCQVTQCSKKGDSLVTRNGNSSVTSTRTAQRSATSVSRWVKVKIASTSLRAPLSGDGRTSTPVKVQLRP